MYRNLIGMNIDSGEASATLTVIITAISARIKFKILTFI